MLLAARSSCFSHHSYSRRGLTLLASVSGTSEAYSTTAAGTRCAVCLWRVCWRSLAATAMTCNSSACMCTTCSVNGRTSRASYLPLCRPVRIQLLNLTNPHDSYKSHGTHAGPLCNDPGAGMKEPSLIRGRLR